MSNKSFKNVGLLIAGLTLGAALQPLSLVIAPPQAGAQAGCQTFPQTGKQICGRFLDYWTRNGALAQQGLPLSGEFQEKSDLNGQTYTVQYFERAVFEKHPENAAPYDVLLSQLGTFQFKAKYPNGDPAVGGGGGGSVQPTQIPAAPTSVPAPTAVPTATQAPATNPPKDLNAYAAYLEQKYSAIGSYTMVFSMASAQDAGGIHSIDLYVDSHTFVNVFSKLTKAEAKSWAEAVQADAKSVWPSEKYRISLGYGTYSKNLCTSSNCIDDCYYQSSSYTSGQGWFTVFTYVLVRSEGITTCDVYLK